MSDIGKYKQPQSVPVPNTSGYPEKCKPDKMMKMRGTGAATKGCMFDANPIQPPKLTGPINIFGR
jgi:hypothetical protein